jgi:hypothetical protein
MLLHATDAEGDGTGMSDRQLHNEELTIFLAEHPEVAARLQAEVDALGHAPTVATCRAWGTRGRWWQKRCVSTRPRMPSVHR